MGCQRFQKTAATVAVVSPPRLVTRRYPTGIDEYEGFNRLCLIRARTHPFLGSFFRVFLYNPAAETSICTLGVRRWGAIE